MPISGGKYVAPTWANNTPPAINASELNAISTRLAAVDGDDPRSVATGGTGQTNIADAMFSFINGLTSESAITMSDFFPFVDISASAARIATIGNLRDLFALLFLRATYGTYTGSGTAGSSNPTSIAFSSTTMPKLLLIRPASGANLAIFLKNDAIGTSYKITATSFAVAGNYGLQVKRDSDYKLYWYASNNDAAVQMNTNGTTYYYWGIY